MAGKLYICIQQVSDKYLVYPSSRDAYLRSKDKRENYIWYYTSVKDITEFAEADTFNTSETFIDARDGIKAVDPVVPLIYKPIVPPTPPDGD